MISGNDEMLEQYYIDQIKARSMLSEVIIAAASKALECKDISLAHLITSHWIGSANNPAAIRSTVQNIMFSHNSQFDGEAILKEVLGME